MLPMMELTHYLTVDGHDPFQAWLDATKKRIVRPPCAC
jgi:hypothetical protein